MKRATTPTLLLTPLLALLSALPQSVLATTELGSRPSLQHVYVVGPDPSGRAKIGQALTRLGYASTSTGGVQLTMSEGASAEGYSYTEIPLPPGEDMSEGSYIVARPGVNQTVSQGELSSLLARRAGVEMEGSTGAWWRRMTGFAPAQGAGAEGELMEMSIDVGAARGLQAEKWVALCDFLGLGYSTVERMNLWQFP